MADINFNAYIENAHNKKGEWISFPISEEEFFTTLNKIGIGEENDSGDINSDYYISEYEVDFYSYHPLPVQEDYIQIEKINELASILKEMPEEDFWKFSYIVETKIDLPDYGISGLIAVAKNLNQYTVLVDILCEGDLGVYIVENEYDTSKVKDLLEYLNYEAIGNDRNAELNGVFSDVAFVCKGQPLRLAKDGVAV